MRPVEQFLALLASMISFPGELPPQAPPSVQSLQQSSRMAPRVPLDQIIPVSKPAAIDQPAQPTKPRRQTTNLRSSAQAKKKTGCRIFRATVYGPPWGGINGPPMTASGVKPIPGRHLIAVDPDVIPLGSRWKINPNPHAWQGSFLAADTGGAIQGRKIDIFMWQGAEAMDRWGVRSVRVCPA